MGVYRETEKTMETTSIYNKAAGNDMLEYMKYHAGFHEDNCKDPFLHPPNTSMLRGKFRPFVS